MSAKIEIVTDDGTDVYMGKLNAKAIKARLNREYAKGRKAFMRINGKIDVNYNDIRYLDFDAIRRHEQESCK